MAFLCATSYHLNAPLMAIEITPSRSMRLTQIPYGSTVELTGDFKLAGMVEIVWLHGHYAVFEQDLDHRAQEANAL